MGSPRACTTTIRSPTDRASACCPMSTTRGPDASRRDACPPPSGRNRTAGKPRVDGPGSRDRPRRSGRGRLEALAVDLDAGGRDQEEVLAEAGDVAADVRHDGLELVR